MKEKTERNVVVINKSGNPGKTTMSSDLIAPRLQNLGLVAYVESVNSIPSQYGEPIGRVYAAHEFGQVESELLLAMRTNKSVVVDFGASDFNTTVEMLSQYSKFKDAVDLYVVPCTVDKKIQTDTVETILTLLDLGVEPQKIRVIFNRVAMRDKTKILTTFAGIFKFQEQVKADHKKTFVVNENIVVMESEAFKRLGELGLNMAAMLADKTDYSAAVTGAQDEDEKFHFANMDSIQGLVVSTNKMLDKVFKELMLGV